MNMIKLSDRQLELVRRAMLDDVVVDMKCAASQLSALAELSPWPAGCRSSDAQSMVLAVREGLDVLEAIGWPPDAPAFEQVA